MADTNSVQESAEGAKIEGASPSGATSSPEPSLEERVAKLVDERIATESAKLLETAKREIQSAKDRGKAEVEAALRRATLAEHTATLARTKIQESDPDIAKELELEELRAKVTDATLTEQQGRQRQQQLEFHNQFIASLRETVSDMGIDPDDKRIDWAANASDTSYFELNKRVLRSATKIQQGKLSEVQSGLEARVKELEAKVSTANIDANSVDTTTSGGVASGSDAEFLRQLGNGELPMTKGNRDRYSKITKSY